MAKKIYFSVYLQFGRVILAWGCPESSFEAMLDYVQRRHKRMVMKDPTLVNVSGFNQDIRYSLTRNDAWSFLDKLRGEGGTVLVDVNVVKSFWSESKKLEDLPAKLQYVILRAVHGERVTHVAGYDPVAEAENRERKIFYGVDSPRTAFIVYMQLDRMFRYPPPEDSMVEAWERYVAKVHEYADTQFTEHVKPWLKENSFRFVPGNGDWGVYQGEPCVAAQIEHIPEKIEEILRQEVPGMPGNDLGSLMPEYPVSGNPGRRES